MEKQILEIFEALWRNGVEITLDDATAMYNTGKGLQRLSELECGVSFGYSTRVLCLNEKTGRYYYQIECPDFSYNVPLKRNPYAIYHNRLKRLAEKYPGLSFKTQGDPRGYVLVAIVNNREIGIF